MLPKIKMEKKNRKREYWVESAYDFMPVLLFLGISPFTLFFAIKDGNLCDPRAILVIFINILILSFLILRLDHYNFYDEYLVKKRLGFGISKIIRYKNIVSIEWREGFNSIPDNMIIYYGEGKKEVIGMEYIKFKLIKYKLIKKGYDFIKFKEIEFGVLVHKKRQRGVLRFAKRFNGSRKGTLKLPKKHSKKENIFYIIGCFLLLLFEILCFIPFLNAQRLEIKNEELDVKDYSISEYRSYYANGAIRKIGAIKNDSININEELEYYPSGNMKYRFYNVSGVPTYIRIYNEEGDMVEENGHFYSHIIIEKPKFSKRESSYVDFFVASPPKTSYKICGINKNRECYELPLKKTKKPYHQRMILNGDVFENGEQSILFKVIFTDSIKNAQKDYDGEFSFEVVE